MKVAAPGASSQWMAFHTAPRPRCPVHSTTSSLQAAVSAPKLIAAGEGGGSQPPRGDVHARPHPGQRAQGGADGACQEPVRGLVRLLQLDAHLVINHGCMHHSNTATLLILPRSCAWLNHSSNPHAFIELVQQYPNIRLWFRCGQGIGHAPQWRLLRHISWRVYAGNIAALTSTVGRQGAVQLPVPLPLSAQLSVPGRNARLRCLCASFPCSGHFHLSHNYADAISVVSSARV